jgi:Spy/CpxP family protein refolding chaperone
MNKTVTTIFALIGIFLCGAIVGGVVAVRYVNVTVQKKAADRQLGNQQWMRITNRLKPTEEQRQQIRALVTAYMESQQKSRGIEQEAIKKLDEGIRAVLTPVQASEYGRIRNRNMENEKLWQRWYREQRTKHGESPMVAPKPVDAARERKAPKDSKDAKTQPLKPGDAKLNNAKPNAAKPGGATTQ